MLSGRDAGTNSRNLGACTGECDAGQCARGLTCFQRSSRASPIPGCRGSGGGSGWDYCTAGPIPLSGRNDGSARGLSACNGECDSDTQCEAGTVCFQREDNEPTPGCFGPGPSGANGNWDYCAIAGTPNLLRGRTPAVSSTHSSGMSAREMTDGNQGSTRNLWHSRDSSSPWAEVRFVRPTVVAIVRLWNRVDCCDTRINGAQIYGRDEAGTLHRIGRPLRSNGRGGGGGVGNRGAISRSWYGDRPFVSIRVQQRNGQHMQIAELEAYGGRAFASSPPTAPTAPPTARLTRRPTRRPTQRPTTATPSSTPATSSPTARPTLAPSTSPPTVDPTASTPSRSPTSAPTTDAARLAMCSGNGLLKRSWSGLGQLRTSCECYVYAAGPDCEFTVDEHCSGMGLVYCTFARFPDYGSK